MRQYEIKYRLRNYSGIRFLIPSDPLSLTNRNSLIPEMEDRPLILITNDDGVYAKGLAELVEVLRLFGNIIVVAPDSPRSGMSHAITVDSPLRINKHQDEDGLLIYSCTGTPVDCVKLACNQLLERLPDFVISGINHGANTSISILY
jgi:5'-nucleotidase